MKTEKKIEQCEKLLAELKDELLNQNKPEFKVGDWVVGTKPEHVYRIRSFYGGNNTDGYDSENLRLATESEIKSHLIEEAERRGYKLNVKYKDYDATQTVGYNGEARPYLYSKAGDYLTDGCGGAVYCNGKWAEIIKNTVKLNDEYEAEIYDDHIKVGCQTFSKDVIKKLYKAIK